MSEISYKSGNKFCHIKTGNIYTYCREIINATNSSNNEIMIMYSRDSDLFVREKEEFLSKFVKIIEEGVKIGAQYK